MTRYIVTRQVEEYCEVTIDSEDIEGLDAAQIEALVYECAEEGRWHQGGYYEESIVRLGVEE